MESKAGQITIDEAKRAIYIDFEGLSEQPPAILGVLYDLHFQQYVLMDTLRSAAEAKSLITISLQPLMDTLIEKCGSEDRYLVGYSTHDLNIINKYTSLDATSRYKNARKMAVRWGRRFQKGVGIKPNSLEKYLDLIGYEVPKHLKKGNAASRLRYTIEMLDKHGTYDDITRVAKAKWKKLLDYNRHDVVGMHELVMTISRDMSD